MTEVTARPARDIDVDSFADLTPVPVVGMVWVGDGQLRVTFDGDLTAAVVAAVRRRMQSTNAAEEQLRERAEQFIAADPATVTHAQLVQVVQRLARLQLRDL